MRKGTKNWKQKDGSQIRICDMETRHIENAIAMLNRFAENSLEHGIRNAHYLMEVFHEDRGSVAYGMYKGRAKKLEESGSPEEFLPDICGNLVDELKRRELDSKGE